MESLVQFPRVLLYHSMAINPRDLAGAHLFLSDPGSNFSNEKYDLSTSVYTALYFPKEKVTKTNSNFPSRVFNGELYMGCVEKKQGCHLQ